jgi:hypothetical protein
MFSLDEHRMAGRCQGHALFGASLVEAAKCKSGIAEHPDGGPEFCLGRLVAARSWPVLEPLEQAGTGGEQLAG